MKIAGDRKCVLRTTQIQLDAEIFHADKLWKWYRRVKRSCWVTISEVEILVCCRCHTEYEKREAAVRGDPDTQKKFHSFVLFLGELYLNLEVRRL